ncbi:MAG: hypothetical protein JSR72_06665 [Proteobacteria bacterium]|nr:hypothetical protein [Pseudomonadota bacterium]
MTGKRSRPPYLFEMMQGLGIDPSRRTIAQSELTLVTALQQCRNCRSKEQCRAWLDQAPMSFAFAPGFCPNKDLLFDMQFDQGGTMNAGPTPESDLLPKR